MNTTERRDQRLAKPNDSVFLLADGFSNRVFIKDVFAQSLREDLFHGAFHFAPRRNHVVEEATHGRANLLLLTRTSIQALKGVVETTPPERATPPVVTAT